MARWVSQELLEQVVHQPNQERQEKVVFQVIQVTRGQCNQGNHLCPGNQYQRNQEGNQVDQIRVAHQGKDGSPVVPQTKVAASSDHRVHRRAFSDILKAAIDFIVA